MNFLRGFNLKWQVLVTILLSKCMLMVVLSVVCNDLFALIDFSFQKARSEEVTSISEEELDKQIKDEQARLSDQLEEEDLVRKKREEADAKKAADEVARKQAEALAKVKANSSNSMNLEEASAVRQKRLQELAAKKAARNEASVPVIKKTVGSIYDLQVAKLPPVKRLEQKKQTEVAGQDKKELLRQQLLKKKEAETNKFAEKIRREGDVLLEKRQTEVGKVLEEKLAQQRQRQSLSGENSKPGDLVDAYFDDKVSSAKFNSMIKDSKAKDKEPSVGGDGDSIRSWIDKTKNPGVGRDGRVKPWIDSVSPDGSSPVKTKTKEQVLKEAAVERIAKRRKDAMEKAVSRGSAASKLSDDRAAQNNRMRNYR